MKSYEAQQQAAEAIARMKQLRDTLGEAILSPSALSNAHAEETQRLTAIHDKLAAALAAYARG